MVPADPFFEVGCHTHKPILNNAFLGGVGADKAKLFVLGTLKSDS